MHCYEHVPNVMRMIYRHNSLLQYTHFHSAVTFELLLMQRLLFQLSFYRNHQGAMECLKKNNAGHPTVVM